MLGGVFRHFAGVLNFSWALLEASQKVPCSFLLPKRCKKPSKASKSKIYIPTTKRISEKNKILHSGWFLMFFCPHPRKAHRIKTIYDGPKVLTLTPSTFWWAGAPPAIWVGGMTPCCSCIWPLLHQHPGCNNLNHQNTPVRTEIAWNCYIFNILNL